MTTDQHSLLNLIARKYANGRREDVAVDSLGYVLSNSKAARIALTEKLRDVGAAIAPITAAATQVVVGDHERPDLACFHEHRNAHVLIEAKFWAKLTDNQPNAYLDRLPDDEPSVLLFVAPAARLASLWRELQTRLSYQGRAVQETHHSRSLIAAADSGSERHLILVSWADFLADLARRAGSAGDADAVFNICQLQALASREDDDDPFLPVGPDDINQEVPRRLLGWKTLVDSVIKELVGRGWAKRKTGRGSRHDSIEYYGRLLDFAGAEAWFGLNHRDWIQRGNTPLWLELYWTENVPEGHSAWPLLDELEEKCPGQGMDKDGHVPIFVPKNSDQDPVVTGIVERLEQIGKLIDPDGPTYADAWKLS